MLQVSFADSASFIFKFYSQAIVPSENRMAGFFSDKIQSLAGFFFVQFSGESKLALVRDFELDHFWSWVRAKIWSILAIFSELEQQFWPFLPEISS